VITDAGHRRCGDAPLIGLLALITVSAAALMAPLAAGAGAAPRIDPLEPLTLTGAGVDAQRHPFARWTPTWPLVNILVASRPVRRADGTPPLRYWVQTGFMGSQPPVTSWRGDEPLVPGAYFITVSGDAAFQHSPYTPFQRVTVKAKQGEWTGPTSQKRYIRFRRPGPGILDDVSFSVYGANDGCHASFALRRRIRVRDDGRFSARFPQAPSLNGQTSGDVQVRGRMQRHFARGTLRVERMFEGCKSRQVRWTARP
jgi:hypothetical protein